MIYVYAPEVIIAMQKELQNHPKLLPLVQAAPDWNVAMAEIGAYLNILLDGWYDPLQLMDFLLRKLREKSTILVESSAIAKPDPELIMVQVRESADAIHINPIMVSKTKH